MSTARLRRILDNIDAGKPINLNLLLSIIEKLNLRERFSITDIESSKVKGDKYRVHRIKPALAEALRVYVGGEDLDRVSASAQNQSHNHKVIGSYLNVLLSAHNLDADAHPVFIMFDTDGHYTLPPNSQESQLDAADLLIIENVQMFLLWQQTIELLKQHCGFKSNRFDIALGRGNEISNTYHKRFLSSYSNIYMCLDIDLGGMMIAKNIINLVPDVPYQFLIPTNIDEHLGAVIEQIDLKTLNTIRDIGSRYAGLSAVALAISRHTKTIEQESFLHV